MVGRRDLVSKASYYVAAKKSYIPILLRQSLQLPLLKSGETSSDELAIRATVTRREEWLNVEGRLVNTTDKPRYVFVRLEPEERFRTNEGIALPGLIQLYGPDERLLTAEVSWREPNGHWVRKTIDTAGLPFGFRFRQRGHFSQAQ